MKILAALLFLGSCSIFAAPKDPPVTLHVGLGPTGKLTPGSAFELRFNEPMVAGNAVGKPDGEAPVQFKPAVTGKWIWVSSQSGVFQLTEPPPLGTEFQVTLRNGLQNAEGKPFRASLKETYTTPAFRLKGWYAADYWDPNDAIAKPRLALCFPAEVDAAETAKQLYFTNDAKVRVEARPKRWPVRHSFVAIYHRRSFQRISWNG